MPVEHVESADGTPIAFRRTGEGEPVLFVHGAATSGADWVFALPHLRDRFQVVTMDRRGRGKSGDAPDYAIDREAEDVVAVLEATGAELLVGHSYGALCSILALQRTDRVSRFVMYEPPIGFRGPVPEPAGDDDATLARFLAAAGSTPEQLEMIRSSPAWPVLLDAVPPLRRELTACSEWQNPAGPIDVPTLYLIGADTTSASYLHTLDELLSAFTDVRRVEIPGQQHIAHVFAAEAFAELVAGFLSE